MADLEAHAQIVGAVVEQQDGKDAVVDDGADQAGGAVQQGLQVEGGIERVSQAEEKFALQGLDADLRRSGSQVGAGPVVSLKGVLRRLRGGALGGGDVGAGNFFGHRVLGFRRRKSAADALDLSSYRAGGRSIVLPLAALGVRFAQDDAFACLGVWNSEVSELGSAEFADDGDAGAGADPVSAGFEHGAGVFEGLDAAGSLDAAEGAGDAAKHGDVVRGRATA